MIKKSSVRILLATLVLASFGATVWAGGDPLLKTEEGFVSRMGDRAVSVAPGVYEVKLESGERIRVGFGEAGRRFDQARLRAELREARRSPDAATQQHKIQVLTRALRGLETSYSAGREAASTGNTCSYGFSLDGGHTPWLVGGATWGEASIGLDVDFSPMPPSYPRHSAYTYVATSDGTNSVWDDDFDEVTVGHGYASTSAEVNCGYAVWECASWESFSYVMEDGCINGYHSIYRSN